MNGSSRFLKLNSILDLDIKLKVALDTIFRPNKPLIKIVEINLKNTQTFLTRIQTPNYNLKRNSVEYTTFQLKTVLLS